MVPWDTQEALAGALQGAPSSWTAVLRRLDARLRVLAPFCVHGGGKEGFAQSSIDDLLQDTYLEMLQSLERFEYRGPGSLERWAAQILVHKACNAHRRRSCSEIPSVDLAAPRTSSTCPEGLFEALRIQTQTPSREASDQEAVERVRAVLCSLPDELREALILRVYEGLSNREAAARLALHESVVSDRYQRALRICGKRLKLE